MVVQQMSYMQWLVRETATRWWNDSGDPDDLAFSLEHGATGVTTNPVLLGSVLPARADFWAPRLKQIAGAEDKAEARVRAVVQYAAGLFEEEHTRSGGKDGFVCAQVNPGLAGDRDAMMAMAKRFHTIAPNVAVKLPVTAAGLDVLEECVAQGMTITATVSFCVPQVLAVAEHHRRGAARAKEAGKTPGRCFAVIMIGRIDDYLRDVALDARADISESDIRWAGIAITKRAHAIFKDKGYEAELLVAALRGKYHMTELAGADFIMSLHPKYQAMFLEEEMPREERIAKEVPADALDRLMKLPEFVRSYEPDGLDESEFITYGVAQRTLSQFLETGWKVIETCEIPGA